jgi:hypothetical protein
MMLNELKIPIGAAHHATGNQNSPRQTIRTQRIFTMRIKLLSIAPLLLAGAAAAAIAAAPGASAAGVRTCSDSGGASLCQSPGNVEIHAEPPQVSAPRVYGPFSSPFPFLFN